jgi:hypothetical protein
MSDHDSGDGKRGRLEGVIPELLKRAVERGVEKATGAPGDIKDFLAELKLPKEIAHYLFSQVDETKNGLFRVVAKEMRDFLEHTNIAGDVQKVLTTVQFEINTTIRFTPNDGTRSRESKASKEKDAKASKDAKDDRARDSEDSGRGEGRETAASEGRETAASEGRETAAGDRSTLLPKPEVKTEMYVKRDDSGRDAGRRTRRGQE